MMRPAEWKDWLVQRVKPLLDTCNQSSRRIADRAWAYILSHKKQSVTVAVTLVMGATSVTYANYYYTSNMTPLYHVMLNGKEMGVVDNPEVVRQWTEERLKEQEQKHHAPLTLSDNITFAEEQVFKGQVNNQETLQTLEKEANIQVEAIKVMVEGKLVGYAANQEQADKILADIKERFSGVPMKKTKNQEVMAASLPTDKQVKSVKFKEKISLDAETVPADKIIPAEKLEEVLVKGTAQETTHSVKSGDTVSGIAKQYGITQKEIFKNNPGVTENTLLQLDQKLNVTEIRPYVTVQVVENATKDENIFYQIETKSNAKMPKGESKVVQEGKNGLKRVQYEYIKENGQLVATKMIDEDMIQQPVSKIIEKGTKVIADRGTGRIAWPARGYISSGFGTRWGRMHKGIDIAGSGTVKAADNGRVVQAGWNGDYGISVTINHGNGTQTLYGHLRSAKVKVGQVVSKGGAIGIMGSTGDSTGVHLHFEVHKNGRLVNPLSVLR
ncbi:peptidoglycan DD-metalloendopeptidase family protein [Brevibacillus laterosporus]|uniref:peptidoglycan DD-metalloendopeptidase family protein n=1 Tax=Brevibacillus laterosporus TaxID=1465 RepID=UPI0009DAC82F|nr:peptidoglycan DD-metalloendopeptidase family protein [Brevibacillus laterosporus]MED4762264.1 peptidoglycan DD-metalloendopeptidase family protein [Brevibacillus laterosporus]NKQ22702.1 peptidoglycan DD-metalloendopeptidase family protein [Brevibacillus laterosporus]TPH19440.1 LysM peptidoglycan-binding domain-containing protein [Brevibacillus laterosporus]WNX31251.1 peptidoglycan DD-metalloendopeptidase family protein [Brevibacillus laterosporus]